MSSGHSQFALLKQRRFLHFFAVQALVILISPAVSLERQPDMVGEPATALSACRG